MCQALQAGRPDRSRRLEDVLMVDEQRFRRLKAPELMGDVYLGAQYVDGIIIEATAEEVAA